MNSANILLPDNGHRLATSQHYLLGLLHLGEIHSFQLHLFQREGKCKK